MSASKKNCFRPSLETLEGRQMLAANLVGPLDFKAPASPALVGQLETKMAIDYGPAQADADTLGGRQARSLVGFVSTVTLTNETRKPVKFYLRWSSSASWKPYTLSPGQSRTFWSSTLPSGGFGPGAPRAGQVRFDWSFKSGFQEKKYSLPSRNEIDGRNGPVGPGKQYVFRPVSNGHNLYARS